MKKFFTLLAASLLFAGGAQADNLLTDDQTFTWDITNYVSSADDITTGYYLIMGNPVDNPSLLYSSGTSVTKTAGSYNPTSNAYVFHITNNDGSLTIQAYNGYYLSGAPASYSEDASSAMAVTASAYASGADQTIKNTSYVVKSFYLKNSSNQYWNQNNNASGSGGWSAYALFPVTIVDPDYPSLVGSNIKPYYDAASTGYFLLTEAGKTALNEAGYEDALTSCTQEKYENLKSILDANIQYPETGYYRIKSSGSATQKTVGYIGLGSNSQGRGDKATGYGLKTIVTNYDQDASTVLYLEVQDATAHTYTISTQNEWATGATAANHPVLMTADKASAGVFTIGAVSGYPSYCDIKQPTSLTDQGTTIQYFHEAGWGNDVSCVCVWTSGAVAAPSRWQIEDVADDAQVMTPTLHAAGGSYYATLNLAYGATVEGATAYYGKLNAEGNALDMTEISEIPANTPVVLVGDAASATVKLKKETSTTVENNALTGNYFSINWTSSNLTLGSVDDVPGFYTWSDGTTLEANKAYYVPAAASVRGLAFHFGDETTSINTAATTNATSGKVYDLQGRRVQNAQKGLYIVGGKKVLVK